ncbi:MAG TPA: hypothetical protein VGY52_00625 [Roseiarcus sp.]|jgi:hypothetical protein|nr:hypothetical protein [Roseiarcus sp.]
MSQRLALSKIAALRRIVLGGALALAAASVVVGAATPAAAMFRFHGGGGSHMFHGGGPHMFFHGGGPHMAFGDFHHRFNHNRFGFAGFGPGFDFGGYDAYDQCLQRVWGPYGWRWINVCY